MGKGNNYIDGISKILTALIAVGGFIWGIIEFQQRQLYNETYEFRYKLWEQKLKTYTELRNVSGDIIVYRNDSKKLDSLQAVFDRLYYSAMIMVEDTAVEEKVIDYREALSDFRDDIKSENYLKKKQIEMIRELSSSIKKRQKLLFDEK